MNLASSRINATESNTKLNKYDTHTNEFLFLPNPMSNPIESEITPNDFQSFIIRNPNPNQFKRLSVLSKKYPQSKWIRSKSEVNPKLPFNSFQSTPLILINQCPWSAWVRARVCVCVRSCACTIVHWIASFTLNWKNCFDRVLGGILSNWNLALTTDSIGLKFVFRLKIESDRNVSLKIGLGCI